MVISPCVKGVDPRIRRTRQLLQQALEHLLVSRPFEQLSVQDITDAATVNRATFYAHYPDKFALLQCLVARQFGELLQQRGVRFDGTCPAALKAIVLGVCDFLATASPCLEKPARLEPQMEIAIITVVRGMILEGLEAHGVRGPAPVEMIAGTISWAIYGGAREWMQSPRRIPAEDAAETVMQLIGPMLPRNCGAESAVHS